jgi:hypothetical protein
MKIISYSIFGKEKWYRNGLIKNIEIAEKLFPDWLVKVYACSNIDDSYLRQISNYRNVELIVQKENYPFEGFLWRMLPMQEGHEAVIVRDVDTRLFLRDKNLVEDWLKLNFKYHLIRDNPGSNNLILAGSWGGKEPKLDIENKFHIWREGYIKNKNSLYLYDNDFLRKHVYAFIRHNLIVYTEHVKMSCEKFIRKIPGERGFYNGIPISIGMYVKEDFELTDENKSPEDVKAFGRSRNQQRLEYMKAETDVYDKNFYTYDAIFLYKSNFINYLFLLVRVIFHRRVSLVCILYVFINNRIFCKMFGCKKLDHNLFDYFK